ncbi:MAG: S8 family serine peptidase [Solirubrobacterales bacterium]
MKVAVGPNRALRALALALFLVLLASASASAAVPAQDESRKLAPPLAALADPALADQPAVVQDEHLGFAAEGPGSLARQGGRLLLTARFERGALSALPRLREAGARIVSASRLTQTVTVSAEPALLTEIAAVPGLRAAWPVREPIVFGPAGPCEGGATVSEGLAQLRVDDARQAFELRGSGVTVGVLSDSYDTAKLGSEPTATDALDDVLSGDLPGPAGSCSDQQLPVRVLDEGPGGQSDEGRAMLQIVHDLAPHADLAFATAFESEESFAQNIERLARPVSEGGAGAEVIADDVSWFEEPFFQDGPIAVAIDRVSDEGVSYFSAAGNDSLFDSSGREIASWEAPSFRDSLGCPEAVAKKSGFNGFHCMDFNPGATTDQTFGITVGPKQVLTLDLQWAEPWDGVLTDLDAFLLSAGGQLLATSSSNNAGPTGTQRPVEILQWENEASSAKTVQLAINRFSGISPRLKFILLQNGSGVSATEYPQSSGEDVVGPAVFGHAGSESAIAIAAAPFNNSAKIEPYSSRGPVTHLFGPVTGSTPALPLGLPKVIPKPDLAATDCGATTFFAFPSSGTWRFCGTSAAAPHAAAIAALVRQAKPSLPAQQVRSALTDTAAPVGTFPAEAAGAGMVDAFAAIASLPGPIEGGDGPSEPAPPLENPTAATTSPPAAGAPAGAPAPLPTPTPSTPSTSILRHPPKLVRTGARSARLVFRFGSDQAGATFFCKLDRARFRACPARFERRYPAGRHQLQVKAGGAGGLFDPSPAAFRFRVVAR